MKKDSNGGPAAGASFEGASYQEEYERRRAQWERRRAVCRQAEAKRWYASADRNAAGIDAKSNRAAIANARFERVVVRAERPVVTSPPKDSMRLRTAIGSSWHRVGATMRALAAAAWRRRRMVLPVSFGVVLIAVPTAFSIFPGWTHWSRATRVWVLIGWLVVALIGVALTALADNQLHRAVERAERRTVLRDLFTAALMGTARGVPGPYELTVYMPSEDHKYLFPVFPPVLSFNDPSIFRADAGAVGLAWQRNDEGVVVVTGEAVSNAAYHLTERQRQRYSIYRVVAATVIREGDRPLGALTAIARNDDGFFSTTDEGAALEAVKAFKALARNVSFFLPEALPWMMPER
jgi:hypothetical protein